MTATLFLISLIIALYIVSPWLITGQDEVSSADESLARLLEQKEKLLYAYKDLDLDFKTDKMTSEDYSDQKASLLQELDGVYKSIDAITGPERHSS